jgi:hypothetical protein
MHDPAFEFYFVYETSDPAAPIALDMDCFILGIECASGDVYELRVWTEDYLARVRERDRETGDHLGGQYLTPPDLVVAHHDVDLIERVVADLIRTNGLREAWHIPDELTASWSDDSVSAEEADDPGNPWLVAPVVGHADCGCCHAHPDEG